MTELSRRRAIGLAGAAGLAGVAMGSGGAVRAATTSLDGVHPDFTRAVRFYGRHQAGIVTPAQDRLHFAAFDLTTTSRADLVDLMREWTAAAAAMTAGRQVGDGALPTNGASAPDDTGEALGLPPARLTITVGFGPGLFALAGKDRFGLAARRPAALAALPGFSGDRLDPARSGGDLAIQACADDPQVAVHAVRNLARIAHGVADVRWTQLGFGRTSSTSRSQQTPRNLMGFKDGTANLTVEDAALIDRDVWVHAADGSPWLADGSYLVARRIRMHIEAWDRSPLDEQEGLIGRDKGEGAPLGQHKEFDPIDLTARDRSGHLVIPADAHVRAAHPDSNGGSRLLRRGYSFVDGSDGLGRLDAGLFFLAYQRDPQRQFVRIQRNLAAHDGLNEYLVHTGSALFACPPGVRNPTDWFGRALLT